VSEAFRAQQEVNTDNVTLVVAGFPEEGNDLPQLHEMFDFLGCKCDIIRQAKDWLSQPLLSSTEQ
jgi:hypothetical protein